MKYKKQQNKKQNKRGRRLTKIHTSTFIFVALGIIMINITLATIFTGLITKDSSSKEYNIKLLNTNSKPHSSNLPKLDFTWIKTKYSNITGLAIDDETSTTTKYDALITIYPEEEVGRVRDDFYGVNTHGYYLGEGTRIDANGDGIVESPSDLEWHRQTFLDSGMKYMRWDAGLEYYYVYDDWRNLDFENWTISNMLFFNSTKETGAVGWKVSTYGGGEGIVSQSIDSHTGDYAMNILCNESNYIYLYRNAELKEGNLYNFSIWIKGNGTFNIKIQRLDNYENCGYKSFYADENWQLVYVTCKPNATLNAGYRIVIDSINNGESLTIDDANFSENGNGFYSSYFFIGNISNRIKQLKWADNNKIKVLLIMSYMPSWLADKSIEGCNIEKLSRCPPYDYNIWGNITLDYLNRLTENGKYAKNIEIEVWNEPYLDYWLSNLPYDNIKKAEEYVKLYNSTYNAIKSKYPNIVVGGPSGFREAPIMTSTFLSNLGNKTDFISIHPYDSSRNNNLRQYLDTKEIFSNCSYYNVNCSRIILSEWNLGSIILKNQSILEKEYGNSLSQSYISILNTYPSNISMLLYQWSELKKYSPNTNYPEYPQRWSMVSEPQLDNAYYPSYKVTKNFAHYHASKNMIVNSSSNNNNIKSVTSLSPKSTWHITVINTGISNMDVGINLSSTEIKAIKDLSNDKIYPVNAGIANVGVLTEYDVKHYEGLDDYEPKNNTEGEDITDTFSNKDTSAETDKLTTSQNITEESDFNGDNDAGNKHENEEKSSKDSNKIEEENEDFSLGEYSDDVAGTNKSNLSSKVHISKSYIVIIILLMVSIILTSLIIYIIYKKRKRESPKIKVLIDWVSKARELGYSNKKMKQMLSEYNWDKKLVEKVVSK